LLLCFDQFVDQVDRGGEPVSQYLPNNSAHQRASRNFTATEAA
jgi:hypothetical protein